MGAKATAVKIMDKRTSPGAATHRRHLTTTSLAHQKLATLSSKSPRLKGKMRDIGSRMAVGLSQGRKRRMKVTVVVTARRKKRMRLDKFREDRGCHGMIGHTHPAGQGKGIYQEGKTQLQEHNIVPFA